MARDSETASLKRVLLRDVAYLCRHAEGQWNEAIALTLSDIRDVGSHAVLFGGALRSLLVSRLFRRQLGRPRDVDVVVAGATIEQLKERFQNVCTRQTRFGGLRLQRMKWEFDVWPLESTWAFLHDHVDNPDFEALPQTTFFNLEAVAIDVWPTSPGRARRIYSGDGQFFDGILARTLELNRAENPFPGLCVVRSLVMAASLDFFIGPKLAKYIATYGSAIEWAELDDLQRSHYGAIRYRSERLYEWIQLIADEVARRDCATIKLPLERQLTFWPESGTTQISMHIHALASDSDGSARRPGLTGDRP